MNPTNANAPAASPRILVVGLGGIGLRMAGRQLPLRWNVVTFDSLSSRRHNAMRNANIWGRAIR